MLFLLQTKTMTKDERKKVTNDQINRFFASYYPNWRLQQILTTEKILQEKFTFYSTIISETKQADDVTGEYTIAQEITNGLLFDVISVCVQYIEDLFALLKAGENKISLLRILLLMMLEKLKILLDKSQILKNYVSFFIFPFSKKNLKKKILKKSIEKV